jgi:hypothetical protein
VALPADSGANAPLVTMAFQSSPPQPAKIQQSFQGLSCGAFQQGSQVNSSVGVSAGFIPLQVMGDPFILVPGPTRVEQLTICSGVFAQVGGGANLANRGGTPIGGTLSNPGTPMYTDGTLSTLIVTGLTVNGQQIRCSDLTDTAPVHDSDLVQPYFVIETNSVVLAIGSTELPLKCQLNVPAGDQAGSLSVTWAKT